MRRRSMPERELQQPKPLRIGLLTHSVNPRGGVVHTLELAQALHEAGHRVTVIAPAPKGQGFFRPVRCSTHLAAVAPASSDMVRMVASRIVALRAAVEDLLRGGEAFDVLHAHDPIGGNALADLRERGAIDGFVRTVHHLEHFESPQLMHWQSRGFRSAAQLFCVSRLWRDRLAAEHGLEAHQVDNGIDSRRFSPGARDAALALRLGVRGQAPVLLAVGGVEERKNTLRLLQAFIRLRALHHPQAQLVVAGGASLLDHSRSARDFAALAQAQGLAIGAGQPIVLTGPLADEDMPGLYRLADVVAMPSLNEGFGLVVLEALASGVPVVVSRIAPFTDYLREGEVQWADPLDADSIAAALHAALSGRDAARIASAADRLGQRFDWRASAARHVRLYRQGLGPRATTQSLAAVD